MECYSAIKRNKLLLLDATYKDLRCILLSSERVQKQCTIGYHLYDSLEKGKLWGQETAVVATNWRSEERLTKK